MTYSRDLPSLVFGNLACDSRRNLDGQKSSGPDLLWLRKYSSGTNGNEYRGYLHSGDMKPCYLQRGTRLKVQ